MLIKDEHGIYPKRWCRNGEHYTDQDYFTGLMTDNCDFHLAEVVTDEPINPDIKWTDGTTSEINQSTGIIEGVFALLLAIALAAFMLAPWIADDRATGWLK